MKNNLFNNNSSNIFIKEKKKSDKIYQLLTNKKFLIVLSCLVFISTSVVVTKAFILGKKVDHYEEVITRIDNKLENMTVAYRDNKLNNESLKATSAASELVSCINSNVDISNLPPSITEIITEINNYYNQSNNYFAFKYKDIYTGFTIAYNENQKIFTASTIKAPTDIYIYEMASLNKIDLSKTLKYTGAYYNTGTGVLKNKSLNTTYDIKTLIEYSIVTSDNAAHNMLIDKFGRENMHDFWSNLGTDSIFSINNNWGVTDAHDAAIYMEELYNFYLKNEEYGKPLMNLFLNASPKFINSPDGYQIANKSGWSGSAIHDASIIFADNPYIFIALSNLGNNDYYQSYFNTASKFASRLHNAYWKYKMESCNSITQYK